MGWVKLDDQRAMNIKLRKAGFEARGLDEAGMCQVATDKTDGFISEDTVETLGVAHRCPHWRQLVELLVAVGRWHVRGHDCADCDQPAADGWMIHAYLEYNPSKAEWEEEKAKRQAAGKRGGRASAEARAQANRQANRQASAQADPSRPVPTRPDPSSALADLEQSSPLSVDGDLPEPENHTAALRRLALRDLEERRQERPDMAPVKFEFLWLMKAMERRRREFCHELDRLAPDLDVNAIIQEIDMADPHRKQPHDWACECEGTGLVAGEDGFVLCGKKAS